MTGVILAAGVGSRLRPLTDARPKCLLTVGGKPLLQRALEALLAAGIHRCVIVTGYLGDQVERTVNNLHLSMDVEFIRNPAYNETNNNYSLWLTRPVVGGRELLLMDGDILFHPEIIRRLLASPYPDALVIRTSDTLGHEEIKCELDTQGVVKRIGKHLEPRDAA
ncbi:MAG TPA: phosphocholine cytidylyltransferase family protein, partial [Bacteroidota bacterium]|nr:phosphocholine cytidylyltransferase family protein [Bacteroidota bacterium]